MKLYAFSNKSHSDAHSFVPVALFHSLFSISITILHKLLKLRV